MSNNSLKNLQNKLTQLKNELSTNEPDRRADAIKYLLVLEKLVKESYLPESTSDYMFIKTLSDSVSEIKYFGGFAKEGKERLSIIEKRYNYIHEEQKPDIE